MTADSALHERLARLEEKSESAYRLFQQEITAAKEAVAAALKASENASAKYEIANERRLSLLNEFRAQSADQEKTFSRRTEVFLEFESVKKELNALSLAVSTIKDKGIGASQAWLYFVAGISGLVALGSLWLALAKAL